MFGEYLWALTAIGEMPGSPSSPADRRQINGTLTSSKFFAFRGWLTVAAVRTPQVWTWANTIDGPAVHQLPEAQSDLTRVVQALANDGSTATPLPRLQFSVRAEDALDGAAMAAVTTVPLGYGVSQSVNSGAEDEKMKTCHVNPCVRAWTQRRSAPVTASPSYGSDRGVAS